MKKALLIVLLLIQCLIPSCYRIDSVNLEEIESVLSSYPDSALLLLQRVDQHKLLSSKNRAYYSLMKSAALDKNYIDIASDSLIAPAVEYYSKRGINIYRMMAYYYQGIVFRNAQDYSASIIAFEKAEKDALKLNNQFYLGLISRNKAHIYNSTNNILAAIKNQIDAINYFRIAQKDNYAAYSTLSLAIEYINNGSYDLALQCLDELNGYESLQAQHDRLKAGILVSSTQDYEQAVKLYKGVPSNLFDLHDCALLALALEKCGERETADIWLSEAYLRCKNDIGKGNVDFLHGKIEALRGNYESAFNLTSNASSIQDSVTRFILQQSISESQRDFYKAESLLHEEKVERLQDRFVFSGIMGVVIFLIVGLVLAMRHKENERIQKEQMFVLKYREQQLDLVRRSNAHLIGSLFRERLNHLDSVSDAYLNADDDKGKYQAFIQFKSELATMRKDQNLFASLEKDLNLYCNGLMEKLSEQVPTIKGENKNIIMLFFAGLPYDTIQLIMNKNSKESLKMARSRYRKEILESKAPDADIFLAMLKMKKAAAGNSHESENKS